MVLLVTTSAVRAGEIAAAERRIERAAETARASIVTVFTEKRSGWDLTGVVVGARDVVLTLRKPLLEKGGGFRRDLRIRFPGGGKTVPAEVMVDDEEMNIVLLRAVGGRGRTIKPRPTRDVSLGMWVVLVGNTFSSGRESEPVVSLGIVSGIHKRRDGTMTFHASTLVNPGSFGAPVVDLDGGLLGILGAAVTGAGGQSVVIPYETVRKRFAKSRKAARILGAKPYPRPRASSVADLFGKVMEAAARTARDAVVGVRSGKPLSESAPNAGKPSERPASETPPKKEKPKNKSEPPGGPRRPRPPAPARVPGAREGHDRSSGIAVAEDLVVCPLRVTGWPGPRRQLTIDSPDGSSSTATVLGTDERLRLALLRVRGGGLKSCRAAPESAAGLAAGRFVAAIGYPHGNPGSQHAHVTFGIVSRVEALAGIHPALHAIQTDAGISGGNRGGALVDLEGRVLGVILDVNDTSGLGYQNPTRRGAYGPNAGLGFAVPVEVIMAVLPRLKAGATLKPGRLGVSLTADRDGVHVRSVAKESGAAAAGVMAGDRITKLNGKSVPDMAALRRILAEKAAGDELLVTIRRKNRELSLKVTLR